MCPSSFIRVLRRKNFKISQSPLPFLPVNMLKTVSLAINSDDQLYTKSLADRVHKFGQNYYAIVLSLSDYSGTTVKKCHIPYFKGALLIIVYLRLSAKCKSGRVHIGGGDRAMCVSSLVNPF